jgi:hypothetical protein
LGCASRVAEPETKFPAVRDRGVERRDARWVSTALAFADSNGSEGVTRAGLGARSAARRSRDSKSRQEPRRAPGPRFDDEEETSLGDPTGRGRLPCGCVGGRSRSAMSGKTRAGSSNSGTPPGFGRLRGKTGGAAGPRGRLAGIERSCCAPGAHPRDQCWETNRPGMSKKREPATTLDPVPVVNSELVILFRERDSPDTETPDSDFPVGSATDQGDRSPERRT